MPCKGSNELWKLRKSHDSSMSLTINKMESLNFQQDTQNLLSLNLICLEKEAVSYNQYRIKISNHKIL
jgi:hypothetical protein